jgi:hypothetical protein
MECYLISGFDHDAAIRGPALLAMANEKCSTDTSTGKGRLSGQRWTIIMYYETSCL